MTNATTSNFQAQVIPWGNSLGLRITKGMAQAAGLQAKTQVNISAEPGRIVIETVPTRASLDDMLAAFDPERHGGEVMAFTPGGREVW